MGQNSSETSGDRESFTEDERMTCGIMELELNAEVLCKDESKPVRLCTFSSFFSSRSFLSNYKEDLLLLGVKQGSAAAVPVPVKPQAQV